MTVANATIADLESIRQLYLAAFSDEENELVARCAVELFQDVSSPPTLHLKTEEHKRLIGHIAFSPLESQTTGELIGYLLAPLAVHPDFQRRGTGSTLVREGLKRLKETNEGVVLVYGDPDYYGRFSFKAELAKAYSPPYELSFPHGWQALRLTEIDSSKRPEKIQCVKALDRAELW